MGIVCIYVKLPEGTRIIEKILSYKMTSLIVTTVLGAILFFWNYVAVQNWNNWHNNPTYAKTKRDSVVIPEELREISYEEFTKL